MVIEVPFGKACDGGDLDPDQYSCFILTPYVNLITIENYLKWFISITCLSTFQIFEDSMKATSRGGSLEMAEYLQSKVTHILFQLVHKFPTLAQAFIATNGYAMLAKVLTSSKSIVGYQLLKVHYFYTQSATLVKIVKQCMFMPHLLES